MLLLNALVAYRASYCARGFMFIIFNLITEMVARLKLKGIDGRAPPGVNGIYSNVRLAAHNRSLCTSSIKTNPDTRGPGCPLFKK